MKKILISIIILLSVAVLVLLHFYNPAENRLAPDCIFHATTGYYCPGCGTIRAFHHLMNGQFLTALDLNALAVLLIPVFIIGIFSRLY